MEVAHPRTALPVSALPECARGLAALFLLLLSLLAPAPLLAQTSTGSLDPALAEALDRPGDLVLRDTDLSTALFTIGQEWQTNIVVGREVDGVVNGVFHQTPLREILDSILLANGYAYRPVGRSLVIVDQDSLGDYNPLFTSETLILQAANPTDVVASASLLSSPQGKVEAIPSAHALLVIDYPDRVDMIRRLVGQLDAAAGGGTLQAGPLQVEYFAPQFVEAVDLKESVNTVLTIDGRLSVIESENRLIVVDRPQALALAREVVARLDVPRPQVRITSLIYDISMEDMERIGINWDHSLRGTNSEGETIFDWALDSMLALPAAAGNPAGTMTLATMRGDFDLTAVIDFLQTCDDSRLLADPTVIVVDRKPASIQIVTEIPIQQLTQTGEGGNIASTAFRDAGVTLTVVPHIADNGTILMDVTPIFSRLTGFTTGDQPQPIIDKREASTTVRVFDGHTFVLGGLRQRQEVGDFRRIPYLSEIPYAGVGKLFRYRDTSVRESELVVFIRPQIVGCGHLGTLREQQASAASQSLLSRIPAATDHPCAFGCRGGPYAQRGLPIMEDHRYEQLYQGVPYGEEVPADGEDVGPGPVIEGPVLRDTLPQPEEARLDRSRQSAYPFQSRRLVAGGPPANLERMPGIAHPQTAPAPLVADRGDAEMVVRLRDSALRPVSAQEQERADSPRETWLKRIIRFR